MHFLLLQWLELFFQVRIECFPHAACLKLIRLQTFLLLSKNIKVFHTGLLSYSGLEPHHLSFRVGLQENHRRRKLTRFLCFDSKFRYRRRLLLVRQLLIIDLPFKILVQLLMNIFTICPSSSIICLLTRPLTMNCRNLCLCLEKLYTWRLLSFCHLGQFMFESQEHSCILIFPLKNKAHLLHLQDW